jgi:hypothetical protein
MTSFKDLIGLNERPIQPMHECLGETLMSLKKPVSILNPQTTSVIKKLPADGFERRSITGMEQAQGHLRCSISFRTNVNECHHEFRQTRTKEITANCKPPGNVPPDLFGF